MRTIINLLSTALFSAVLMLPLTAAAQQWIMNCTSNLCLDATKEQSGGIVQISTCDRNKVGQQWDAKKPESDMIQNRWNEKNLDVFVKTNPADNEVQTTTTNAALKAQHWEFTQNWNANPIKNKFTNQCLDAGANANLTAVKPVTCVAGKPEQQWKWVNVGDDAPNCPPH